MGHFSLPTALAAWALAFPAPRPTLPPPGPVPQLSKADAEWAGRKYQEAVQFGRAGRWGHDEAQAPVREILDLCTRKLGENHYLTATYRREISLLKKLAGLPAVDRQEYQKTYVLTDQMSELWNKQQYVDALKPVERVVATYRRLLGPESTYVAMAEIWYGQLLRSCDRYEQSERELREALRIRRHALGEYHPDTIEATIHLALTLERRGGFAEAGRLHKAALDLSRRVLGEGHERTAVARNNLASNFQRQARYADAEELYRPALAALIAAGGEDSPFVPTARNNLAITLNALGKYGEAEGQLRRALVTQRKAAQAHFLARHALDPERWPLVTRLEADQRDDLDTALFFSTLAVNLDAQARHTAAEHLHRAALGMWVRMLGASHTRVAETHSNLGVNLDYQGKYIEAESHLDAALRIFRAIPKGETSIGAAIVHINLASCLGGQGKHVDSQAAAETALAIFRDRLPPDHPNVAVALNNLASSFKNQGRYADADRHFRAVLATLERRLGEEHPDTGHAHTNLGINLFYQGRIADADPHLRAALASLRRRLGEGHPRTAWAYKNVVGNLCARGDFAGAEAVGAAATESFEAARLRLGFAGVDRALRTTDLTPLPGLAVAAARRERPAAAWEALERNLARGLLDHLAAAPLTAEERKRERGLLEKLNLLDRRINETRARNPRTDADRDSVQKAEADRQAAQTELAELQAGLAEKNGVTAGQVYKLADIQRQIPDGAALVAWVDLPLVPNWHDRRGDHWACLVKRTGAPVWVQLRGTGPDGAWTNDDDGLAARFLASVNARHPKEDWKGLKERLARQRLGPLAGHLPGVRHLVVLPSAGMAGIPVDVLTGLTVSYAPSGTMFAWLREKRAAGATNRPRSLLAVGDPAFHEGDNEPARLKGTRQELAGISRLFDLNREFKGAEATEQNLDRLAAEDGGLGRFPYLHFATHGVLDDQRPMRSALLLAPGSEPDQLGRVLDGKDAYDGRLTAERILRRWKLDAELVTLSACQTGLGRQAGGDGYLGFSQALFVAGARSLVLSLWEVDDTATALLMIRFYENLMGLPKDIPGGPLAAKSKAEALREAKEWLQRLTPDQVSQLAEGLPRNGKRGRIVPKAKAERPAHSFEHPYYWSGFVLVGDPK